MSENDIEISGGTIEDGAAIGVNAGPNGAVAVGEGARALPKNSIDEESTAPQAQGQLAGSEMARILCQLNWEHLIPKFTEENIVPEIVNDLSDDDLKELGVVKMGDRASLRKACSSGTQSETFGNHITMSGGTIGKGAAIGVVAEDGGAIAVGEKAMAQGSNQPNSTNKGAATRNPVKIQVSNDAKVGAGAAIGVTAGAGGRVAVGKGASAGVKAQSLSATPGPRVLGPTDDELENEPIGQPSEPAHDGGSLPVE